jgi:regulator of sirC expression with transglutaminase-like and TPR domain
VKSERLSPDLQGAFLALLDDDAPAVRNALIAAFTDQGPGAVEFLQEVARGSDRLLARHASWFLHELHCCDPVADFTAFVRSLNYELETGSLLLSRTISPGLDVGACCARLDEIAKRCRQLLVDPSSPREKCRVVSRVLFHEWGFRGSLDHPADPRDNLLDHVLARRKGLPVALCIVYLLVAQRVGLALEPVALPGHFVVGCFLEDRPFFIDPYACGMFRSPAEVFMLLRQAHQMPTAADLAPTPVREVLCRCCRNLASHYAGAGDPVRARLFAGFVDEFEAIYRRHAEP